MTYQRQVVVLRFCKGLRPAWQFYSMPESVVGGGDTIDEARLRYRDGLAFALELSDLKKLPPITEYVERETSPGSQVWVRIDSNSTNGKETFRAIASNFEAMPEEDREWIKESLAASGDTIILPVQPRDSLRNVLEQITPYDSVVLVALAEDPDTKNRMLMWQPVDGNSAQQPASGEESVGMSDAGLTPESPISDVFQVGMTEGPEQKRRRVALASA